jgi:hypothetical protein
MSEEIVTLPIEIIEYIFSYLPTKSEQHFVNIRSDPNDENFKFFEQKNLGKGLFTLEIFVYQRMENLFTSFDFFFIKGILH